MSTSRAITCSSETINIPNIFAYPYQFWHQRIKISNAFHHMGAAVTLLLVADLLTAGKLHSLD